jgi:hypothetical protein
MLSHMADAGVRAPVRETVRGVVVGDGARQAGYRVFVHASCVEGDRHVMLLASVAGTSLRGGPVVVNERTTVAMGTAFAQFVNGRRITGNTYGMLNAVRMAENIG